MSNLVEKSMTITKASFDPRTNTMRFRMVCSDIDKDVYDERMSLELFNDFTSRIDNQTPVPTVFRSVLQEKSGWEGGMPYVSVAHYKSGKDGANIPADVERVYVDGEMLKSTAVCRDTDLGKAVFYALKNDLKNDNPHPEGKIRVSIGFLDLQHAHGDIVFTRNTLENRCPMCENGDGDKVYLKGQLVHLALTRSPANPRTETEVDMAITTKREDAESIVGKALAEEIEVNKTALDEVSDVLVVKADMPSEDMEDEEECTGKDGCTCKACKGKKKQEMKSVVVEDSVPTETPVEKSALETVLDTFRDEVVARKSMSREDALRELQPAFELVAKAVQDEFVAPVAVPQIVTAVDPQITELLMSMKSMIEGMDGKIASLSTEVTILKSQGTVTNTVRPVNEIPTPRGLQIERSGVPGYVDIQSQRPMNIRELALRSVQSSQ